MFSRFKDRGRVVAVALSGWVTYSSLSCAEGIVERAIQVYLLAASRLVRDALTRVITRKGDIRVIGAQASAAGVVASLLTTDHDVLVVDWGSAGPGILGALAEMREHRAEHKSLLLGMKGDRESFLQAVRAGVKGILLEDASASDVTTAIHSVAIGQAVCPPSLCYVLFDLVARQSVRLPNARIRAKLGLTRREQQLVPLIAQGFTNKEIASHLRLSEQTVKNHIHRMLQKTGVTGRLEVVEACDEESPAHWGGSLWV